MAINVYTGLMGSGKTYEVVSNIIVPALAAGRRVVSNIEGLQVEKILDYVDKKFNPEKVGELVVVDDAEVKRGTFFPVDDKTKFSTVKDGDLVCIDEAWKFWPAGSQLLPTHMEFFRKHRHYVDEKGVACDLALMIQDISDLHRSLKNVVEMTFRTEKLKSLGASKKYRVEFYSGSRPTAKNRVGYHLHSYNTEIFPLYQSYSGGTGKEVQVDDRQNIFKAYKTLLIYGIPLLLIAFGYSIYWLYSWSTQYNEKDNKKPKTEVSQTSVPVVNAPPVVQPPQQSSDWRIVGQISMGEPKVVLQNSSGAIRIEHPSNFKGEGLSYNGTIDGKQVSRYNYSNQNSGFNLGDKK